MLGLCVKEIPSFKAKYAMIMLEQILQTTLANLKVRYRQSWAGVAWVFLSPLLTFGVQGFVFHLVLKIPVENYLVFLASGLIPWIFIAQSTEMSAGAIVGSAGLLRSYPVHPFIPVGAQVGDCFVNFAASFLLILTLVAAQWTPLCALLVALSTVMLLLGVAALAFFAALVQVFYRDFKFLLTFALQLLFYLSPIIYPEAMVPESVRGLIALNPVGLWIRPFREAFASGAADPMVFLRGWAFSFVLIGLTVFYWRAKRNELGHYLG